MHSKNPHEDCKSWRTVWNWQFLSQLTLYPILINRVALIDYGSIKSNPSTLNAIPLEHVFYCCYEWSDRFTSALGNMCRPNNFFNWMKPKLTLFIQQIYAICIYSYILYYYALLYFVYRIFTDLFIFFTVYLNVLITLTLCNHTWYFQIHW